MKICYRSLLPYPLCFGLLIMCFALFNVTYAKPTSVTTPVNPIDNTEVIEVDETLPLDDIQRFTTAISQIKRYYVKDVEDEELFENAIRGMLTGLDPHSAFLDEEDLNNLRASTTGKFGGLGIEVGMEDDVVKVISPIDDTPAQHAGVKAGDLIIRLDNTPVRGMELSEAVKLMRGEKGTPITLTIYRESEKKVIKLTVVRDIINIKSVKSDVLDSQYGYIRVSHFQQPSATRIKQAVSDIIKENKKPIKGWILDLRNNPGGLLDAAVDVSNLFLDSNKMGDNKYIVYTKGRIPSAMYNADATPGDILKNVPLVVLINEGSASAAEIVAGALQDHGRALIIGMPTFGKGSVQTILPIDEDAGIKLTTSLYYTPSGRSIQADGISPDVFIEMLVIVEQNGDEIDAVKEAHLTGHLDGADEDSAASTVSNEKDTGNLAHDDYQLYQALNILKSMAAVNRMQAKANTR